MAISWRDKIEFSHEFTEEMLDFSTRSFENLSINKEPLAFDLEYAARMWNAQAEVPGVDKPEVFINAVLTYRYAVSSNPLSPLLWNFWIDTLANVVARGTPKIAFEEAVSERWLSDPTFDDEETLRELAEVVLDQIIDTAGNINNFAYYFHHVIKGMITLLPPGAFMEMLVARKPSLADLARVIPRLYDLPWEHRVAIGEVIDQFGDPFYDQLTPDKLTWVLKNAPHPRAVRKHMERADGCLGPKYLLTFFEDDDELVRYVDIDTQKSKESARTFSAARAYLHRFGFTEEGLARFADAFSSSKGARTAAMTHIHSPFVVPYMYEAFSLKSLSSQHPKLEHWLKNEGANAIEGLVALAKSRGKKRDFALEYLRSYLEGGHEDLIRESMSRAPKKVVSLLEEQLLAAVEEEEPETLPELLENNILSEDDILSLEDAPAPIKQICAFPEKYHAGPDFSVDVDWPVVRLANNGKALSPKMLERICAALCSRAALVGSFTYTLGEAEKRLEGKEEEVKTPVLATLKLRELLDPEDAEELWFYLHSRTTSSWVSQALADLGGSRAIPHAAAVLRRDRDLTNRYTDKQSTFFDQYALFQGIVLTDRVEAWRELARLPDTITQTGRWGSFDDSIARIHKQLLAHADYDRVDLDLGLVPLLGLDEKASRTFDYGGQGKKQRTITFHVDATLQCVFEDNKGKRYSSIPSARKGEDREAVEQHKNTMKWMRSVLERAFEGTRIRLETMLKTYTKIPLGKLRHELIRHPWQRHFLRSLIWGSYEDGALAKSFLCDLDGALTDAAFDSVDLPDDAIVGLVHPLELDAPNKLAWEQTLAESELIQPFRQLEREVLSREDWPAEKDWLANTSEYRLSSNANRLLKLPGWESSNTKRRGGHRGGKIWFASFPMPDDDIFGAAMVIDKQWNDPSAPGDPGIYFFKEDAEREPDNAIAWEDLPERIISELLLDFRAVFDRS
jgi:hypothetical protein